MEMKDFIREQEVLESLSKLYVVADLVRVIDTLEEEDKERVDQLSRGLMRHMSGKEDGEKLLTLFHYLILLYTKLIKEGYTDEDIDGIS
jgi:hypothetical protein